MGEIGSIYDHLTYVKQKNNFNNKEKRKALVKRRRVSYLSGVILKLLATEIPERPFQRRQRKNREKVRAEEEKQTERERERERRHGHHQWRRRRQGR